MKKILSLLLIALTVFAYACQSKQQKQADADQKFHDQLEQTFNAVIPPLPMKNEYRTPKGVYVSSVSPIPVDKQAKVFEITDNAIQQLFDKTPDFSQHKRFDEYVVMFTTPTHKSEQGQCPLIDTKNGISIAGQAFGFTLLSNAVILVPENFDISADCNALIFNSIYNEGEHVILFYNNFKLWQFFQGAEDWHPLIDRIAAMKNDPDKAYLFQ